jgi:hypothetical protein
MLDFALLTHSNVKVCRSLTTIRCRSLTSQSLQPASSYSTCLLTAACEPFSTPPGTRSQQLPLADLQAVWATSGVAH